MHKESAFNNESQESKYEFVKIHSDPNFTSHYYYCAGDMSDSENKTIIGKDTPLLNIEISIKDEKNFNRQMANKFFSELSLIIQNWADLHPEMKKPEYVVGATYASLAKIAKTLGFTVINYDKISNMDYAKVMLEYRHSEAYKAGKPLEPMFVYITAEDFEKNFSKGLRAPKKTES